MLQYLFDCRATIPDGVGFSLFSPGHLLWLANIALVIFLCCRKYNRLDDQGKHRFRVTLTALMLADELLKIILLVATGQFDYSYLPLHLCSINIFTSLWYTVHPNKMAGSCLYYLSLPGAVIALLSPSWVKLPFLNIMNFHSFSIHGLLILYPILLLASGQLRPKLKELWMPAAFMVAVAPVIYWLNTKWDTNFMFLNGTDNNPILEAVDAIVGPQNHILGMTALVLIVWTLITLPWVLGTKKALK